MPSPTDGRAIVSILATDRALAWYLDEVRHAKTPPIDAADADALRAGLSGARPWEPRFFDTLMTFGKAMHRLARLGDAPDCNVGDALTALASRVLAAGDGRRWTFDPAVDRAAFAKLEFGETSAGIATTQRDNREGWWAHAQKNRAFIEEAAASCARKQLAVVLGAGHAFDLPLVELARAFERLVVVDIDGEALASTVAATFKDQPDLRARVVPRVMDFTGINGALVGAVDEIFANGATAEAVADAMDDLCRGYRLPGGARLVDASERADLLVSSCVLSQVAWPQRVYAEKLYEKRFAPMHGSQARRWATHWSELELRVQQDHVNALAGAAETVVLTSDVVSRPTALDGTGTERETGAKIYALGVPSLAERIPKFLQPGAQSSWVWPRYQATRPGTEGSRMEVEAVVLREPRSAGGLWLPGV